MPAFSRAGALQGAGGSYALFPSLAGCVRSYEYHGPYPTPSLSLRASSHCERVSEAWSALSLIAWQRGLRAVHMPKHGPHILQCWQPKKSLGGLGNSIHHYARAKL